MMWDHSNITSTETALFILKHIPTSPPMLYLTFLFIAFTSTWNYKCINAFGYCLYLPLKRYSMRKKHCLLFLSLHAQCLEKSLPHSACSVNICSSQHNIVFKNKNFRINLSVFQFQFYLATLWPSAIYLTLF